MQVNVCSSGIGRASTHQRLSCLAPIRQSSTIAGGQLVVERIEIPTESDILITVYPAKHWVHGRIMVISAIQFEPSPGDLELGTDIPPL